MIISIRTSILTLFTSVVTLIGASIIAVNYFASSNVLFLASENLLRVSSNNVEYELSQFLQPAYLRTNIIADLISKNLIKPNPTKNFTSFLQTTLSDLPRFSAAYWADSYGNFYMVERDEKGNYLSNIITSEKKRSQTLHEIDNKGNFIGKGEKNITRYDPRSRPWYLSTKKEKKTTLSDIYLFYPWKENKPALGFTMAKPIYSNKGNLYGIVAIDMQIKTLSAFIAKLKITKNAFTFMFDAKNNLLAAKDLENFSGEILPKINTISLPWVKAGLKKFKQEKNKMFFYTFNGEKYLAYFDNISPNPKNKIYLSITLPVSDITDPLNAQLLLSVFIAISILLFGTLLIAIASNSISKPIIKLANETKFIQELNLSFVSKTNSCIKEIIYMHNAYNTMVQSLKSFVSYVPLAIVKKLVTTGEIAHVGGEFKTATFLFTDITGFTSLAENMEPKKLMIYLSEYLEVMTKTILENSGTVDKYIGDAIMAFWGAPIEDDNQAINATKCALKMLSRLEQLNQDWQKSGHPTIKMRIGINTGNAIIGNVGSQDRLNYTAIGDCVNVTNRLEELNKVYPSSIIISESTYSLVKEAFSFRLLDHIAVRGKHAGMFIYQLLQEDNELQRNIKQYNENFRKAFSIYQNGEWENAKSEFKQLLHDYPNDKLLKIYIERCQKFLENPPIAWDGIWVY